MAVFNVEYNDNIRADLELAGFTDGQLIKGVTRDDIDAIMAEGPGAIYTAMTRAFRGFNHYTSGAAFPANYDGHGYTFFTRPRMKLTDKNCLQDRSLSYMLNTDPLTIPRAIRAYLDPIGSGSPVSFTVPDKSLPATKYKSPLVDPLSPFISILSNSMTSLSGWPDINTDIYTEDAGIMKEQWSIYDGIEKYYGRFNLTSTHVNMRGDPLGLMFYTWIAYGNIIRRNEEMLPWLDSIMDNEKDYESAIFRMVMDPTKTYIQKIARTIVAMPTAISNGASFDYEANRPFNNKSDTLSISWECTGAIYYDPYAAISFNILMVDFNPNMFPGIRDRYYTKIQSYYRKFFRDEGYPWINLSTSELEWYVPNDRYKQVIGSLT